ncbi:hypothetical protein DFJ74DRAFT_665325 [Hyaloraphidium curvatum]|nr:hypothetical protein DFJ74DRAFT_665325 [Hyaloraphidium curvatum]
MFSEPHWDARRAAAGDLAHYVEIRWDALLVPGTDPVFPRGTLEAPPLSAMNWSQLRSGVRIPDGVADALQTAWEAHLQVAQPAIPPIEGNADGGAGAPGPGDGDQPGNGPAQDADEHMEEPDAGQGGSQNIGEDAGDDDMTDDDSGAEDDPSLSVVADLLDQVGPAEGVALRRYRRGQKAFRVNVLGVESQCRLTGVSDPAFLIASHIKPWRSCTTDIEKMDGNNGLMLTPSVDWLFDKGFISFEDDGEVIWSPQLDQNVRERLGLGAVPANVGPFNDQQRGYLKHHRENVFKP